MFILLLYTIVGRVSPFKFKLNFTPAISTFQILSIKFLRTYFVTCSSPLPIWQPFVSPIISLTWTNFVTAMYGTIKNNHLRISIFTIVIYLPLRIFIHGCVCRNNYFSLEKMGARHNTLISYYISSHLEKKMLIETNLKVHWPIPRNTFNLCIFPFFVTKWTNTSCS